MDLKALITGSTSLMLVWDPTSQPSGTFSVYRSLTNSFAAATLLTTMPLIVGTTKYIDYACQPSTAYFYWLVDQNSLQNGPVTATTIAAPAYQDAIDETQMNALWSWAYSVFKGLYPAYWRYQPVPQPLKPKIILNVTTIKDGSWSDERVNRGEALKGGKVATVSVAISSDPNPPMRGLLIVTNLAVGSYTLAIGSDAFTASYPVAPVSSTVVVQNLQDQLEAAGYTCLQYGTDPAAQSLIVENSDPRSPLTAAVTGPLGWTVYAPPKAFTMAQRLRASLVDPAVRELLSAAGIGVGSRLNVNDVSSMLDTRAELSAQFDFYVNVAQIYPVNAGRIDGVEPSPGNFTP